MNLLLVHALTLMAVSVHTEAAGEADAADTTLTEEEARELGEALADSDAAAGERPGEVGTPGTQVDSPVEAPSTAAGRHRSARLLASAAKRVETTGAGAGSRLAQHTAASAAKVKGKGRTAAAVTQATPSAPLLRCPHHILDSGFT